MKSDGLGRLRQAVALCHDGQTIVSGTCAGSASNGTKLHLTQAYASDSSASFTSTTAYTYDTQGRLSGNTRTTTGLTGGTSLLRTTTCYDTLGRVKWLTGATGTVTCTDAVGPAGSYVQSASYTYTGTEMASVITLGNNLVETLTQNMRGQLTDVQLEPLWRLVNAYGTTNNNGNVQSQTLTVRTAPALTTNYTYDMLIRLTQASETANAPNTGWTEAYGYDRYGNRWLSSQGPGSKDRKGQPEAVKAPRPRLRGWRGRRWPLAAFNPVRVSYRPARTSFSRLG